MNMINLITIITVWMNGEIILSFRRTVYTVVAQLYEGGCNNCVMINFLKKVSMNFSL